MTHTKLFINTLALLAALAFGSLLLARAAAPTAFTYPADAIIIEAAK